MTQDESAPQASPFFNAETLPKSVQSVIDCRRRLPSFRLDDKEAESIRNKLEKTMVDYLQVAKPSLQLARTGIHVLDNIRITADDLRRNVRSTDKEVIQEKIRGISEAIVNMKADTQILIAKPRLFQRRYYQVQVKLVKRTSYFVTEKETQADGKGKAERKALLSQGVGKGIAGSGLCVGGGGLIEMAMTGSSLVLPWAGVVILAGCALGAGLSYHYSEKAQKNEREIQRYNNLITMSNTITIHLQTFEAHLDDIASGWSEIESEWKVVISGLQRLSAREEFDPFYVRENMGALHVNIERVYGSLMTYKSCMMRLVDHFQEST